MKTRTAISLVAAVALATTALSAAAQGHRGQGDGAQAHDRAKVERGQRDYDRDRIRDRDRIHVPAEQRDRDQDRQQDRIHQPDNADGIYGGDLMSEQERNRYREQLRRTESDPEARNRFLARHREEMQQRAKEQGKQLGDPPDKNN